MPCNLLPAVNSNHASRVGLILALLLGGTHLVRGEAMLELFNVKWADLTQKMPEIAEAGYDSLWVPNPAKGTSGGYSIGYDRLIWATRTSRARSRRFTARRPSCCRWCRRPIGSASASILTT